MPAKRLSIKPIPSESSFVELNLRIFCMVVTGLPDFHRMVVTIMKTTFARSPPSWEIVPMKLEKVFETTELS